MLEKGRIPLNTSEHSAVDALVSQNPSEIVSLTRRDHGESGPLLVYVGDKVHEVDDQGRVAD